MLPALHGDSEISMEPAEEITNAYLHSAGFFTLTNLKIGLHEVDILAIHPHSLEARHIEVHVSLEPLGKIRPWNPLKYAKLPLAWRIKALCNRKFVDIPTRKAGNQLTTRSR